MRQSIKSEELRMLMHLSKAAFYRLRSAGLIPAPDVGTGIRKKYSPAIARRVIAAYGREAK